MDTLLEVKDLTYIVDGNTVLKDIDFKIKKGEFINIIGPNGSGKTTFIKLILGVYKVSKGSIIKNYSNVGYLSQNLTVTEGFPILVNDVLKQGCIDFKSMFSTRSKESKLFDYVVNKLQLRDYLNINFNALSKGLKQRALLARSILTECEILILDEPIASVDKSSKDIIYELLKELNEDGVTILMINHDIYNSYLLSSNIVYINKTITYHGHLDIDIDLIRGEKSEHFCEIEILNKLKELSNV